MKKRTEKWMATKAEHRSYGMYFMGQCIMYFLPYLFLSTYLLLCGLSAGKTATALIVIKVWDAVNDCIFGILLDKIHFKKGGKFLPWIRISVLPIILTTIALFCIPRGLSENGKLIWFIVAYVLWDTAYTLCDTPIFALVTTMTSNQEERISLMTTSRIYANMGMVIAVLAGNILTSEIVGLSFSNAAVFGGVFALICMSFICVKGKERVHVEATDEEESYTLIEMLCYIKNNKYLLIYYLGSFFQLGMNTMPIVVMFACFYYFKSALLSTVITALSYIPAVILGLVMSSLLQKYNKYVVFMTSNVIFAISCVLIYLVGPKFVPHLVLHMIRGMAYGVNSIMMFMFTPDCAEYGQYKTGKDARGITFSIQTFTQKLNSAVASALGVSVLGLFGWKSISASNFAELAALNVLQSQSAMRGLWISYTGIPAIGAVLAVIVWSFYRLSNEKDIEWMSKYNAGEITRAECERKLSRNY